MFLSRAGNIIELTWSDAARAAALAAREASKKASDEPTEENHQAAAEAHSAAATAYLKGGDKKTWEDHAGLAFEHMAKGKGGWRDAKTGKPNGNWDAADHEKESQSELGKAQASLSKGSSEGAAVHADHSERHQALADKLRSAQSARIEAQEKLKGAKSDVAGQKAQLESTLKSNAAHTAKVADLKSRILKTVRRGAAAETRIKSSMGLPASAKLNWGGMKSVAGKSL